MAVILPHRGVTFSDQVVYVNGHAYVDCTFSRCTFVLRSGVAGPYFRGCDFLEGSAWHVDVLAHDGEQWTRLKRFLEYVDRTLVRPGGDAGPADGQEELTAIVHRGVVFEHQTIHVTGHRYVDCTFRRCTLAVRTPWVAMDRPAFDSVAWHLDLLVYDAADWRRFRELYFPVIDQTLPPTVRSAAETHGTQGLSADTAGHGGPADDSTREQG